MAGSVKEFTSLKFLSKTSMVLLGPLSAAYRKSPEGPLVMAKPVWTAPLYSVDLPVISSLTQKGLPLERVRPQPLTKSGSVALVTRSVRLYCPKVNAGRRKSESAKAASNLKDFKVNCMMESSPKRNLRSETRPNGSQARLRRAGPGGMGATWIPSWMQPGGWRVRLRTKELGRSALACRRGKSGKLNTGPEKILNYGGIPFTVRRNTRNGTGT